MLGLVIGPCIDLLHLDLASAVHLDPGPDRMGIGSRPNQSERQP